MLKERRSRYAKVMIILANGEVNLGGESFFSFWLYRSHEF